MNATTTTREEARETRSPRQTSPTLRPQRPTHLRTDRIARSSCYLGLAQTARGRVLLHLLALRKGGNVRWHLAGVARELNLLGYGQT